MNVKRAILGLILLCLSPAVPASDATRASIGDSRLTAGDDVTVDEPVAGNVFVAAGRATLSERVDRSAFLTGGDVTITGPVDRNLYVAGGDIRIEGTVGRKLRAAGGKVRITRQASVGSNAMLAGGRLDMDGSVGGDLRMFGDSLTVNGDVKGDVDLVGDTIHVGPDARIGGRLDYRHGADVTVDPAAQVAGGVHELSRRDRHWRRVFHGGPFAGGVHVSLGNAILGALLILFAPRFSREAAGLMRKDPWNSAGMGFVMLVGVPIVGVMLLITIIGIPLALLVAFGYIALMLLGYLVAAIFVGDFALERFSAPKLEMPWWRVLAMVLALLAISIVRQVPLLGGVAVAILFCVAVGAFTIRSWQGFRPAAA